LASDSRDDFRGGALHCFCPRAPKTIVTPLPTHRIYRLNINGKNWPVYNEVYGRQSHSSETTNITLV